jgi:hypothetical protein
MTLRRTGIARKSELRRTPMRKRKPASIRTLRDTEPLPEGQPRRYTDGRGYIRLRWKVGIETYVEEYEHRIVMDRPALEVHHKNGVKSDNRPENLQLLTKREHTLLHEQLRKEADPERGDYTTERTYIGRRSLAAAARQRARAERIAAMKADYERGMTLVEIGAKYGVHNSNVSRAIRGQGARMRAPIRSGVLQQSRQVVKSRAVMRCERCSALTTWTGGQVHHRLPRGMGGSSDPAIHSPANLLLLCPECHSWVEKNRTVAYKAGWLVKRGQDPAQVPVEIVGRGPVLLTADGEYQEVPG